MLKVSHVNVGASVALGSVLVTWGYVSPVIAAYALFAVLQDADHPHSAISQMLPFFRIPGGHRGFSHTLWFAWIAAAIFYFAIRHFYPAFSEKDGWILLALCHSHLGADFFTIKKLPLLYPLIKYNFGIPIVTTGGVMEKVFTLSVTVLNVFFMYKVFVDYWLVDKLVFPQYDRVLVYGAIAGSIFTFYGLFKQELADIRRYPMQIMKKLIQTAGFFGANLTVSLGAAFLVKSQFSTQFAVFLNAVGAPVSAETAIIVLFGISIIPSMVKLSDSVDKTSFLFATMANTLLVVLITALLLGNSADMASLVSAASALVPGK